MDGSCHSRDGDFLMHWTAERTFRKLDFASGRQLVALPPPGGTPLHRPDLARIRQSGPACTCPGPGSTPPPKAHDHLYGCMSVVVRSGGLRVMPAWTPVEGAFHRRRLLGFLSERPRLWLFEAEGGFVARLQDMTLQTWALSTQSGHRYAAHMPASAPVDLRTDGHLPQAPQPRVVSVHPLSLSRTCTI